jgi:hypothetical protein
MRFLSRKLVSGLSGWGAYTRTVVSMPKERERRPVECNPDRVMGDHSQAYSPILCERRWHVKRMETQPQMNSAKARHVALASILWCFAQLIKPHAGQMDE